MRRSTAVMGSGVAGLTAAYVLQRGADVVLYEAQPRLGGLHAAEHYGVTATGLTLSAQQRDLVAKRIAARGLAQRVEVRLQDYRDLDPAVEQFDAVSSIEMGEHVGEQHYPQYAGILFTALKPRGPVAAAADVASRRCGTWRRGLHRVLHRP